MRIVSRIFARLLREFDGNNWLKVIADKGIRYLYTILVLGIIAHQWQILNDSLLVVAFTMPIVDIVVFDYIDHKRKAKPRAGWKDLPFGVVTSPLQFLQLDPNEDCDHDWDYFDQDPETAVLRRCLRCKGVQIVHYGD
jgi:hypothetical protein